jgi:hypothetical protein
MLVLLPHAGKSLHYTCTSHEVMVQRVAELLDCVVKHTPRCAMRVEVASQAHHAGVSELGFYHCAKALSVAWCRFPATLSPDFRHSRGSFRAISDPARQNCGQARMRPRGAPRRGKRLIETMVQTCNARAFPQEANQIGTPTALIVVSGTEAG